MESEAASVRPPGAVDTYEGPFHISEGDVLQVDGLVLATVSTKRSARTLTDVTGDEWTCTLRHWFQEVVSWFMGDEKDHIDSHSQEEVRDVAFRFFYKTILGGHLRQ